DVTSYDTVLSVLVEAAFTLPVAALLAAPAGIEATIRPLVVMPVTVTVKVVPGEAPVTAPTSVPPAVEPANDTSLVANPFTDSLNTTSKTTGEVAVGSAWAAAWLIVTVGRRELNVTTLSVLVDARLNLPTASAAAPAGMFATTVPLPVMPVTDTL